MTVSTAGLPPTTLDRKAPPLGGFNLTFLGLEVRRLLRNKRTLIFTLIMPLIFFFLIGRPQKGNLIPGTTVNGMEYAMISFALYGAMTACTSGGSMVAVERALGWSRQLRLTPLRPVAYILTKVATAMVLGLFPVLACFIAGIISGVSLPAHVWILCGLAAWVGSLVFAALGLCVGYLMPSENVMQIMGPVLGILAVFGGIFFPLQGAPHLIVAIAKWSPVYGVGEIARAPLTHHFEWISVLNVVAWTAAFAIGAALLFRRDTKRV
jgi:ABC-2 type transport system permease protein